MTAEKTRAKAKPARKRASKATEPTLYKVLVCGQSCHGGSLTWSLPNALDGTPGQWHRVDGPLVLCSRGIHVTRADGVARWVSACLDRGIALADVEIYECEASAERTEYSASDGGKLAALAVRLIRRVTIAPELAALGIYTSGSHERTSGHIIAYGSSSVRASGSASVSAYGSSSVSASGSASVSAFGSSSVRAYGSSSVGAFGSSSVRAYGSSSVRAYDSSLVSAFDSSSVSAYGSSRVDAKRVSIVVRWATAARVSTTEYAVLVDRSAGYNAPAVTHTTPHNTHPEVT